MINFEVETLSVCARFAAIFMWSMWLSIQWLCHIDICKDSSDCLKITETNDISEMDVGQPIHMVFGPPKKDGKFLFFDFSDTNLQNPLKFSKLKLSPPKY